MSCVFNLGIMDFFIVRNSRFRQLPTAESVKRSTSFLIGGTIVNAAAKATGNATTHDRSQRGTKSAGKPKLIAVSANDIKNDIFNATKNTNKTGAYFFDIFIV